MKRRLLVATRNAGKVVEYAEMLAALDVDWLSLDDAGVTIDVEETGASFLANAVLKAQAYAAMTGLLTLADDSGLEVDALGGAPGIYTARYGGPGLTPVQRYEYLLQNLSDVPWAHRSARFHCVIALAAEDKGLLASADGICEGMIAKKPSGDGGFGYDPVFYLPERGLTMAQLPSTEKHVISHRGRALQAIEPVLTELLEDTKSESE
jgi:XTP/dITP diphosphohydrolase